MKTRVLSGIVGLALVSACAPAVPDSGQGVGYSSDFSRFELERARLEANAQRGTPIQTQPSIQTQAIPSGDLAAAGIGTQGGAAAPLSASGTVSAAPLPSYGIDRDRTAGLQASPGNAPVQIASSGISDEQDFSAVADRETIESDAERRAAQAAAYQVIQPEALPQRTETGPNIVEYALSAPNRRGQEWYSRFVLSGQGRFQRNCADYRSADEAQRDFLARGGPDRDPRGIDPDGDGFACGWDPAPYLAAVGRS